MGHEKLRTEKNSSQVDADFTVPFLHRGIFNGFVDLDRGIVKKHIDPPQGVECLLDQTLHRFSHCYVRLDGERHAP